MAKYEFTFRIAGAFRIQADTMKEAWQKALKADALKQIDEETLESPSLLDVFDNETHDEIPINKVP